MSATPLAVKSFYNQNRFSTPNLNNSTESGKSQQTAPYLPGYLLGNANSPISNHCLPTATYQNNSPSKICSKSPPNPISGSPYSSPVDRKLQRSTPNQETAPPSESLYSNNFRSNSVSELETLKRNALIQKEMTSSLNESVFSPHIDAIPQSPAQIDPFYSEGDMVTSSGVLDDTAVTVFGFPPAASSFILQQFAQYGAIEKHEIHNAGNWLHLKYQTPIQAKKALSKNGKIFARSMMIGVCPCIKKEISTMETGMNSSMSSLTRTPELETKRLSKIRPLSSTTLSPLVRNASLSESKNKENTPQKKDSVVGKALDYVFGW